MAHLCYRLNSNIIPILLNYLRASIPELAPQIQARGSIPLLSTHTLGTKKYAVPRISIMDYFLMYCIKVCVKEKPTPPKSELVWSRPSSHPIRTKRSPSQDHWNGSIWGRCRRSSSPLAKIPTYIEGRGRQHGRLHSRGIGPVPRVGLRLWCRQ